MPVTLTPQIEEAILKRVESGKYEDASEVIAEALLLLESYEMRVDRLREALEIGLAQIERGEVVRWTPDTMARLIREGEEEDRLGVPIKDDVKP